MRGVVEGLGSPHPLGAMLPGVYQEDGIVQRLVGALDRSMAPVLSTLENLDAYVDPHLAPDDVVRWLAGWVGLVVDETWPPGRTRRLVAAAAELYRWRGTPRGVVELVRLVTGAVPELHDSGGVAWSVSPGSEPPGLATPSLVVRVPAAGPGAVDDRRLTALVAAAVPAHVPVVVETVAAGGGEPGP